VGAALAMGTRLGGEIGGGLEAMEEGAVEGGIDGEAFAGGEEEEFRADGFAGIQAGDGLAVKSHLEGVGAGTGLAGFVIDDGDLPSGGFKAEVDGAFDDEAVEGEDKIEFAFDPEGRGEFRGEGRIRCDCN